MKILYRISSGDKRILIPPCDGTRRIATGKLFHVVSDGVGKYIGVTNAETPETEVEVFQANVFENSRDYFHPNGWVRLSEVFPALGREMESMSLTQHQAISFCEHHRGWLMRGKERGCLFGTSFVGETLFLLTRGEVLKVTFGRDFEDDIRLEAECYGYSSELCLYACISSRVVVRR